MKKPTLSTASPPVRKTDTKDRKLIKTFDIESNEVQYIDEKTGEVVESKALQDSKVEPYNEEKATALLELVARGAGLKDALEKVKLSYPSFILWLDDFDFKRVWTKAQDLRAKLLQEVMFEKEIKQVSELDVMEMDLSGISIAEKRLRTLSKKQMVINEYIKANKEKDDKGINIQTDSAYFKLEINEETVEKITNAFRPKKKGDDYVLPDVEGEAKVIEEKLIALDEEQRR